MLRVGLGSGYKAIIATINTTLNFSNRSYLNSIKHNSRAITDYSIVNMLESRPIKVRNRYTDYIDKIVVRFLSNK